MFSVFEGGGVEGAFEFSCVLEIVESWLVYANKF